MRIEELNSQQQPSDTGESGGDLNEVLSTDSDSEFVLPAEKKSVSTATLVLILLVALGGGGLYLMHLKTGPKAVAAAPESRQASETISSFLSAGDSNIKLMEQMLKDTEKVVQRFLRYPSAAQVPLEELRTNPFKWIAAAPANDSSATEIIARKRKEEERQAVIKAVQLLQLQSVMAGSSQRACMINNTMVKEGQSIEGFTVEKIGPNGVIVRQNKYRFELKMQK